MSDFNERIIAEFRANKGVVGGRFSDQRLLLLHTTGAKSGKERVNPLIAGEDGERLVVVASYAGASSHPDWYHNLVANPLVEVEYGRERFRARATVPGEPERTRLYRMMEQRFPPFTEYQKKAGRIIPIVLLTRLD